MTSLPPLVRPCVRARGGSPPLTPRPRGADTLWRLVSSRGRALLSSLSGTAALLDLVRQSLPRIMRSQVDSRKVTSRCLRGGASSIDAAAFVCARACLCASLWSGS